MSLPQVRTVSNEAAEIARFVRQITLATSEIEQLRAEIASLVQQIQQFNKNLPFLRPLEELKTLHSIISVSIDEKREDIQELEKQLLNCNESLQFMSLYTVIVFSLDALGHEGHRDVGTNHLLVSSLVPDISMKTSYTQLGTIEAPTDCVHALAFSSDGRYLASASNDNMIRVYGVKRGFATTWEEKGDCPFTAVTWRDDALFVGSMDGDVICFYPTTGYRWIRRRKSEVIYKTDAIIQTMVFNQGGDQLLVCSGADVLFFKKTSGKWKYHDCLPRPTPFGEPSEGDTYPIVATGLHFLENEKECLIGYLYNGFWKFNLETWESTLYFGPDDSYELEESRRYFGRITASAQSPDSKSVVATDTCMGLTWFKVMPDRLKKMSSTHQTQDLSSNVPLPVLFINQGQAVIMGTTKGCALILEVKRAEKLQALKHGNDQTWVTSLAYIDIDSCYRMIATGDGNREQRTRIILWIEEDEKDVSFKFPKLCELFS
ncbi:WD40-repeat-containing domain protein [Lentinula edodes]|nr:WD40-repeat-containing domain protein [Lentinula edodes]